jgi:hypothetical protein
MFTYSPVDELTLSMKWAVDEMAVDESPQHRRIGMAGESPWKASKGEKMKKYVLGLFYKTLFRHLKSKLVFCEPFPFLPCLIFGSRLHKC